jgi:hypothetical protein
MDIKHLEPDNASVELGRFISRRKQISSGGWWRSCNNLYFDRFRNDVDVKYEHGPMYFHHIICGWKQIGDVAWWRNTGGHWLDLHLANHAIAAITTYAFIHQPFAGVGGSFNKFRAATKFRPDFMVGRDQYADTQSHEFAE